MLSSMNYVHTKCIHSIPSTTKVIYNLVLMILNYKTYLFESCQLISFRTSGINSKYVPNVIPIYSGNKHFSFVVVNKQTSNHG